MKNATKKQEETIREFLHEAVVPLIEDVLVKKLGQAMSYAKEQIAPPKQWVGLTDEERVQAFVDAGLELAYMDYDADMKISNAIEAKLKEKNT